MVGCMISTANAGTCHYFADGADSVVSCGNGAYTVTGPRGHRRQYGEPNGGFERYPGQPPRPIYRRREGD
jgi:hypothetical protein